jgi:glycosyltransferase involved in cell wall biosynthesis
MGVSEDGNVFRILLVSPYFPPHIGGIENHVYELARRLTKYYDTEVITTGARNSVVSLGKEGKVSYKRPWISPLNNPISLTLLFSMIKTKFSLLHVHGLYQFTSYIGLITAMIKGRCSLITVHGRPFYRSWGKRMIRQVYESIFLKILLKRVDRIIALTSSDRDFLISLGVQQDRIVIIPNAVDTQVWTPKKLRSNADSAESRFILYVGALIERKNPDMVLNAFSNISKEGYPGKLIMVGKGSLEPSLRERSDELGIRDRVKFLSGISQGRLLDLYRSTDIVLHPSSMEGLPTVILEAMSTAALVISSDIDAVKNLVYNGENGLLFNLKSNNLVHVLSHALSLSHNEKQRIQNAARQTIIKDFSWRIVAKKTAKLYKDLMIPTA